MSEKSKKEIDYEERVIRRFLILKKYYEQGNVLIKESFKDDLYNSFLKVRFDKNGLPDLSTIDGRLRSISLLIEHLEYRDKLKKTISLFDIQERYFNIINGYFHHFHKMMIENNETPHNIADYFAYKSNDDIDSLNLIIGEFLEIIEDLWEHTAETGYLHLEDNNESIKAVFGGDLFPANHENIASKYGIYTDTIILPCPFIRSKQLFSVWNKKQRVYYLLKHALNVLQYKELALVKLSNPIIVILPDKGMMDEFEHEKITQMGETDTLFHSEKIFGRKFESMEELIGFGNKLDTLEKVMDEIVANDKVLFDIDNMDPLNVQIQNQINDYPKQQINTKIPGIIVSMLGFGRMSVCNEILIKSLRYGAVPLIDAPTSWEYFKWKLQYDTERAFPNKDYSDLHILNGINNLKNSNLRWVGKIPPKGLIELRQNGALNEIRQILSNGIDEITSTTEVDFNDKSKEVFHNLTHAFDQHQKNIKKLTNKKWKIAGKDFGSWLIMGTMEIAAVYTGTPVYGLSTIVLNQILDVPKIKELPDTMDKLRELIERKDSYSKSPIGMILKYKSN